MTELIQFRDVENFWVNAEVVHLRNQSSTPFELTPEQVCALHPVKVPLRASNRVQAQALHEARQEEDPQSSQG